MRGGYAQTRPAFVNIPLEFDLSFKRLTSGSLVVGKKYKITKTGSGFDATGVGAADNNLNTEFVATGTTPSWGTPAATEEGAAPTRTTEQTQLTGELLQQARPRSTRHTTHSTGIPSARLRRARTRSP